MKLTDYDFHLPQELIAKQPSKERTSSRLLVVDESLTDRNFSDILDYLNKGDLLVINDTKVFNARLEAFKSSGGKVEILIERKLDDFHVLGMTKSNRPIKVNDKLLITNSEVTAEVVQKKDYLCKIKFSISTEEVIDEYGSLPLPPYLNREPNEQDYSRYQTVYAKEENNRSTAAPTAGLHFEDSLLNEIKDKGINIASITLDIGLGTFKPITVNDIYEHKMHSEKIYLSAETSEMINKTIESKSKIISVGTTSLRCLEAIYRKFGAIKPFEGETDIFIYPGFKFNVVDTLITNFHLPKTTLLLLVSAFGGKENLKKAYNHAIKQKYMFFSYGDAMFLNRKSNF